MEALVCQHIESLKGQKAHYCLHASKRLYLPESLNQAKLYQMFAEQHSEKDICSKETCRKILTTKYNVSFGYPRTDTCSTCDENKASFNVVERILAQQPNAVNALQQKQQLETERQVHLKRADVFYQRKRESKRRAQQDATHLAICMDYQKNLPAPNVTTNDAYYKRQLTCISFDIHILATNEALFYVYDETIAKKGADDVCSILSHFIDTLNESVTSLEIFCDSCAGQNKNWTVIRYAHYLVNVKKRFTEIQLTFPIRGHSYMECDKDFGAINQKHPAEVPKQWWNEFRSCRQKPSPYTVVEMSQEMFVDISTYLKGLYVRSCPFPTRPQREMLFSNTKSKSVQYRDSWNGPWKSSVVVKKKGQCGLPTDKPLLYTEMLPISDAKFQDLQALKKFVGPEAQEFYSSLKADSTITDEVQQTVSSDD